MTRSSRAQTGVVDVEEVVVAEELAGVGVREEGEVELFQEMSMGSNSETWEVSWRWAGTEIGIMMWRWAVMLCLRGAVVFMSTIEGEPGQRCESADAFLLSNLAFSNDHENTTASD
jgi:hypothetical protein